MYQYKNARHVVDMSDKIAIINYYLDYKNHKDWKRWQELGRKVQNSEATDEEREEMEKLQGTSKVQMSAKIENIRFVSTEEVPPKHMLLSPAQLNDLQIAIEYIKALARDKTVPLSECIDDFYEV